MAPTNLIGTRKRQVMMAAAQRWQARTADRQADAMALGQFGPGAADNSTKQSRYVARQTVLNQAAQLRMRGQLPLFIERKIGSTLDFFTLPPSETARRAGRSVARIVTSTDPNVEPEGFATGFLIAGDLLLTNWHVFPDVTSVRSAGANFLHEEGEHGVKVGPTFALDPDRFFLSHQNLDFAIVAVRPTAIRGESLADLGFLALTEATARILKGQPISIIQYPDGGKKEYATTNNRLIDVLDDGFIHYETDTLEGSSGSPDFSESWELVGLHHAGVPAIRDGQIITKTGDVWSEDMGDDRIQWVANEGIRISAIVRALTDMRLDDPAQAKRLADLLATTSDPAADVSRLLAGDPVLETRPIDGVQLPLPKTKLIEDLSMAGAQFTFTGPVTIHVYAAPPTPMQTAIPVVATALIPFEKTLRFDPDYDHREGFQPDFLGHGLTVPLPTVAEERLAEMYVEDGAVTVLPYHHYSLAMNRERRLQMWSAANVDYDPALRGQGGRASFGRDRWIADPRIPAKFQIMDPDFYGPAGQIDRGHIVRREDSAWGETPLELEFANADTFHWTNCTPQHAAFNRTSPGGTYGQIKGLWGAFEGYVQKSLQQGETRACILAGPVLAMDDPTMDFGTGPIQYPITFWKMVAVATQEQGGGMGLRTYGFVLSQKDVVDQFGIEFAPGQYARYQRRLTEITSLTGVTFDAILLAADTKAHPPVPMS